MLPPLVMGVKSAVRDEGIQVKTPATNERSPRSSPCLTMNCTHPLGVSVYCLLKLTPIVLDSNRVVGGNKAGNGTVAR